MTTTPSTPRPDEEPTDASPTPAPAAPVPAPAPAPAPGPDPLLAIDLDGTDGTPEPAAPVRSGSGVLTRLRTGVGAHPLVTGVVAVLLAAGAGFGGGFAVGHARGESQVMSGFPGGGERPAFGEDGAGRLGAPPDGGRPDGDAGSDSGSDSGTDSGTTDGADT
ncbi:hypothetical protein [Cellulomonas soli]